MNEQDRYSRQLRVPQIGALGQQRIAAASVLLVGAGGLGCQVAAQLAGAGVGQLTLVDHDTVSLSNLHRQILFREADVGAAKAAAAARELSRLNSSIKISHHQTRVSPENVASLCAQADLVVDAGDNLALSYLLSDACDGIRPLVSAAVNRTFGLVGVFCAPGEFAAPSFRAIFPRLPEHAQNCDAVGVTGPSVGMVANLQAQECLKVLCQDSAQLNGQLLYLDLWNYQVQTVDCKEANSAANPVELISASDIGPSDLVLDVRDADEIVAQPQDFRVDNAVPLSRLLTDPPTFGAGQRLVCCCRSGQRALIAAQALQAGGHARVAAVLPAE